MSPEAASFWHAIGRHGERPALRLGDRTLSYSRLRAEVRGRMTRLEALGAGRVALALDNGPDWILWDLALLFGERVCVPVPAFFSERQQAHVLRSAGIDTLIGASAAAFDAGFAAREDGILQRHIGNAPTVPTATRKITYTSGTTGEPKGVCLDAAAQLRVARSAWRAIADLDVRQHLCVLPLATLLENVAGVYAPLLAGACIDARPMAQIGMQGASSLDTTRLLSTLVSSQPQSVILLPQLLHALVCAAEHGLAPPRSLRFAAVGGARVAPQLLHRAEEIRLPVFEGYGLSECASVLCLNAPQARRIGTVGRPLEHARLRIAEDGEVLARGACMLGYLGEAAPRAEWLPTGDLGHLEDGFLVLHGRKKHQFITAFGRNVNPEWVEAELVQHRAIAQAWLHGEARARNVAVLVPRAAACSDAELQAAVAEVNGHLPDYARVHSWLRARGPFRIDDGLLTSNGRLRREALLARYGEAIEAATSARPDGVHS